MGVWQECHPCPSSDRAHPHDLPPSSPPSPRPSLPPTAQNLTNSDLEGTRERCAALESLVRRRVEPGGKPTGRAPVKARSWKCLRDRENRVGPGRSDQPVVGGGGAEPAPLAQITAQNPDLEPGRGARQTVAAQSLCTRVDARQMNLKMI